MNEIRLIDIREEILSDNQHLADEVRQRLLNKKIFMLNLMASPGAGKTSLILETIARLRDEFRIGVIEGDIESMVDSEKISAIGIPAVQLRTGGACHLDAPMIDSALGTMDLDSFDLLFIENVGNLVCPAEFDTGATKRAMILSVPEGDDKVLKYPLMFSVCDALVVNKIDYLSGSDFNMELLEERFHGMNRPAPMFQVSCRTGEGLDAWVRWLRDEVLAYRSTTANQTDS